jgi:hypothetical protein
MRGVLLIVAAASGLCGSWLLGAGLLSMDAPMAPITQPAYVTPIARTPTGTMIATTVMPAFLSTGAQATPTMWCWRCPDARACEGALYLTGYCLGPTPVPYVGYGGEGR